MIPAATECGLGSISPIARNPKHQTTPCRTRRKTSRRDQVTDVHAACSTPERIQSEIQSSSSYSPSDTFPYSQENCPEVVWDYTSPKLPKGAKKRELKITVDEFLKNLTHQAPECNTQRSQYINLLEKWMTKQNTPVCVKKPLKIIKRDSRMRSRQIYEDIKKLVTSIQEKKEELTEGDSKEGTSISDVPQTVATPAKSKTIPLHRNSFLEGDGNDNDSIEELWGEADSSFIIKATQHLDMSSSKYGIQNKDVDIASAIPETVTSVCHEHKKTTFEDRTALNKTILDSEQAHALLTQIVSCGWETDSDNEDLENGFIMEDEALSLIPDEVLCGGNTQTETKDHSAPGKSSDTKDSVTNCENKGELNEKNSCELSFGNSESNYETINQSEIELFNNFEDESFGDESILCKPEVLSWIDEVESKLSQSQKCTPEEIEKKKDAAIQRRKRNFSKS